MKTFARREEHMEVMLGVRIAKDNVKMQSKVLKAMRDATLKQVQLK